MEKEREREREREERERKREGSGRASVERETQETKKVSGTNVVERRNSALVQNLQQQQQQKNELLSFFPAPRGRKGVLLPSSSQTPPPSSCSSSSSSSLNLLFRGCLPAPLGARGGSRLAVLAGTRRRRARPPLLLQLRPPAFPAGFAQRAARPWREAPEAERGQAGRDAPKAGGGEGGGGEGAGSVAGETRSFSLSFSVFFFVDVDVDVGIQSMIARFARLPAPSLSAFFLSLKRSCDTLIVRLRVKERKKAKVKKRRRGAPISVFVAVGTAVCGWKRRIDAKTSNVSACALAPAL